jgi:predicted nucleic acid-binding protein
MNGFLLDTNTVSELVSVKPHQGVLDWIEAADENRLYLSVMTLGEIRQGVAALPQSKKRTRLETWLEVDFRIALRWPRLGC